MSPLNPPPLPPDSESVTSASFDGARCVLHLDLDTFFVSVERLMDDRLRGKPLIIGGGGDRAVVSSCSYEARSMGVSSGMPVRMALRLCPEAILVRGHAEQYGEYSRMVTSLVQEALPVVEKASVDEFYADLSGMDKYMGCLRLATELRTRIARETGLPSSLGLSVNKTVSKVATGQAKPDNQRCVQRGDEARFLAPLSVRKIPMVGPVWSSQLEELGLGRIRQLQEVPRDYLVRLFGKNGIMLWEKARGVDHQPVLPYREQKSLSAERTLEQDSADGVFLQTKLRALAEGLGHDLRSQGLVVGCLTVRLRYADFETVSRQQKIPYTASDRVIMETACVLFERLYTRRMRVRLVGLRLSELSRVGAQMDLFGDPAQEGALHKALDRIKNRFGVQSLRWAGGMG
ncbi:MAG: DNA polymerase IV [Bacteroidia bacterium]|jgi:DNA polymerase-4